MTIVFGEDSIASLHRDTAALSMGLDLHRLRNVEVEILIHLYDVIYDPSPSTRHFHPG